MDALEYFEWSDFDCPLSPGSGERYMDRQFVLTLERIVFAENIHMRKNQITLAYVSSRRADQLSLEMNNSHRAGLAVRIRSTNPERTYKLVRGAMRENIRQIAVCSRKNYVYLANDILKDDLYLTDWSY